MYLSELTIRINQKLGDDSRTQTELLSYMDAVIDDINTALSSKFPTFSEVGRDYLKLYLKTGVPNINFEMPSKYAASETDFDYNFFPDKYLRSVLVVGTALKVYEVDEEGNQTALMFKYDYDNQLFFMVRDYSFSIPEQYQEDGQGYIGLSDNNVHAPGLNVAQTPFIAGLYSSLGNENIINPEKEEVLNNE